MARNPRHIIKKSLLEISGIRQDDSAHMQSRIQQLFQHHILPSLDTYLTKISPNGEILRIDRLELDLGKLSEAKLESEWTSALEQALEKYVSAIMEQHDVRSKKSQISKTDEPNKAHALRHSGSQLELLRYFVETGNLPWWSDLSQPSPVIASVNDLLQHEAASLLSWMRMWAREPSARLRLSRQLPVSLLMELVALPLDLSAQHVSDEIEWLLPLLQEHGIGTGTDLFRRKLVEILLDAAYASEKAHSIKDFWKSLLHRLASANLGLVYDQLISQLYTGLQTTREPSTALSIVIRELQDGLIQGQAEQNLLEQMELTRLLAEWRQLYEIYSKSGEITFPDLHKRYGDRLKEVLDKILKQKDWPKEVYTKLQEISQSLAGQTLKPEQLRSLINDMAELLAHLSEVSNPSPPLRDAFSDAEELFVSNAGLVILWPYLTRFFEHMDLVKEREFVNEAARYRAVGLLQFLADGQSEPVEYLCGLNKIICGLAWDAVLDVGEPITKDEKQACEDLLQAVIENAPILGEMTIDGFRGTFLLRKGILKSGPGMWQLFVESESYDVVLERFPWGWAHVKLPWMVWGMEVVWD